MAIQLGMDPLDPLQFLTARELAEILRVKERKVYDLAAAGEVPHVRVTGKLLFPRNLVDAWLSRHTEVGSDLSMLPDPPAVAVGSHDPLLDWALRESGSGMASFFDGSLDGLARLARREAVLSGMHVPEDGRREWNVGHVSERLPAAPVVVVEWAWRERGLIVAAGNPLDLQAPSDLAGRSVVPRQAEAGSQRLLLDLLGEAGLSAGVEMTRPVRSEQDIALAVLEGKADAGLGLASMAAQFRLGFVPLLKERFDLVVWRRSWFSTPVQALVSFAGTAEFAERARDLGGYDVSGLGRVHFNGP